MINQIDARGLTCPQPVIMAKKALEQIATGEIIAIVDNETAKENIITLAENSNLGVGVEKRDKDYYIRITKKAIDSYNEEISSGNIVILVSSSTMGKGDEELGKILMKSFLYALVENEEKPRYLIFINSGVFLTSEGSESLEHLMALEKQGVEILSCGTCLDFYQLKEKLCVGQVSNMYTIVENMQKADKVINL